MSAPVVITIVGAESTGKSTLAIALRDALATQGDDVALVGETLREFCDVQQRTPRQHEQASIAAEQTRRIDAAASAHAIVIADTTALMIAVYSDWIFGDRTLYDSALRAQRGYALTLLTALDLPWVADGLQRDGAHVREPVDGLLRAALQSHPIDHAVIAGQGSARTAAALSAIAAMRRTRPAGPVRWRWVCERCGDGECERHLLP
jgi:nicotinamide riboside kinase